MKCPKCGKEMKKGEVAASRGDSTLFWLPEDFIDKHWANPYCHLRKTITSEGGMMIQTNSRIHEISKSYGCVDCKMIVIDCGE